MLVVSFAQPKVKLGNDILIEKHLDVLKGKRVGLIINHTARLSSGEFLVDVLLKKNVDVVALFGPEHGIRGEAAAGERISDTKDEKTGIPVFSLYGKIRKPTPEMLTNVDVLVYDIQDVGARFYTYISTMGLCIEAAAEKGIRFIVLDRPDPQGGFRIDGPIIEDPLKSFVGMYPIPVVYGLTCGELATMINEEEWLANNVKVNLTVIKMEGWKRTMLWEETGLQWIPPSPNIKTPEAALVYPATCFIEATNVSEGRGTEKPFQYIGAPFIDAGELSESLNKLNSIYMQVKPVTFTPNSSKYENVSCGGVYLEISPLAGRLAIGFTLLEQIRSLYPEHFKLREEPLLRLLGSRKVLEQYYNKTNVDTIHEGLMPELRAFLKKSSRYYLYPRPFVRSEEID